MNSLFRSISTSACLAMICVAPQLADAQKNKPNTSQKNDERRENEAVRKAQQDVKQAQEAEQKAERSLKKAIDDLKTAERDQQQAASKLQKTRQDLETKHADLSGLTEKRKQVDAARRAYEAAGQPILKKLAETEEFRRAVDAAKAADARLAILREQQDDESDDRRKQMADAARIKQVPGQLERKALDAETSLKGERARLASAEDAQEAAHNSMQRAIANDPALKSATTTFEKAKDSVATARRAVGQEERQLTAARQKLAQEKQDLQRKIAADKRDDNKPNPKKKK